MLVIWNPNESSKRLPLHRCVAREGASAAFRRIFGVAYSTKVVLSAALMPVISCSLNSLPHL